MNKSKIMKMAWEISRNAQRNFGGTVKEYFPTSLKMSWKQNRSQNSEINIAKLAKIGNEWEGYGNHRIYFDNIENYFDDINTKPYERRVNGIQVNRDELESKVSSKIWFNVKTGAFEQKWNHLSDHDMEVVKRNILNSI